MKKRYLQRKVIRGRTRWLVVKTWKENGARRQKSVEIHAEPGTQEFDREYWAALDSFARACDRQRT